jgi:hypothetical protein
MKKKIGIIISVIFTLLICTIPMGLSPEWNGKNMYHRNQYELLAESMLKGKVDIEYDSVFYDELSKMENPYDTEKRTEDNIQYKWDHAYYKGKYYMYFGVVPVIVTFLPYRLITGHSLNTYHATQIYVGIFIIGIFYLFYYLKNKTKSKISTIEYIIASIAVSLASIWYAVDYPALYTTAITSGLMFSILSIIMFMKCILDDKKSIKYLILGSLFGALIFGCRPTIGFVNILFFPALLSVIKKEKREEKILITLLSLLPYIIIAILLMLYNYVRFESVFEFGQTYQLTDSDQTKMLTKTLNINHMLNSLKNFFFYKEGLGKNFPYIKYFGIILNYPMILVPVILLFTKRLREKLKKNKLLVPYILIIISIIISIIFITIMVPYIIVRYHMDVMYLFGILLYINYLLLGETKLERITFIIIFVDIIIKSTLLYFVPDMYNFPSHLYKSLQK